MHDPTLPGRLRRLAATLDRHRDVVDAALAREAAAALERYTAAAVEGSGPVRPGRYGPEHDDPTSWPQCIESKCTTRVDPWEHNTRCADHRANPAPPPIRHRQRERHL